MPTIIINGSTVPVRTSFRTRFDPTRGKVTIETWKQAGGDGLNGLANTYKALGYEYDLDSNPRLSTLVVTSPAPQGEDDTPTDQWQMLPNEINLDVYESPGARALGNTSLAMIKRGAKDHEDGIDVDTSSWSTGEIRLFNLVIKKVQFYPVGQHVLRHTTNANASYSSNVADTNVEAIYSNSALLSEISNASYWIYPAPARIRAIVNARASGTTDGGQLRWGWRKLPSQEITAANNRIDISTEYWFGQHSYFLYPTDA
jgi:hypothetical protein